MISENLGILAFLIIFEILGGVGLGVGLRGLVGRASPAATFFIIWGAGFAGIPLIIGATFFLPNGDPVYFVAEAFVLFMAVIVTAFAPDALFQDSKDGSLFGLAVAGGLLVLFGGVVILLAAAQSWLGVLLGGAVGLLGAFFLYIAVRDAFRTKS